jgi:hypothetical protein
MEYIILVILFVRNYKINNIGMKVKINSLYLK